MRSPHTSDAAAHRRSSSSGPPPRVLLAFYGLLDRGIRITGPSIARRVADPLRRHSKLTVACFDMISSLADNKSTCGMARAQLGCDVYEAESVTASRAAVWRLCGARPDDCSPRNFTLRTLRGLRLPKRPVQPPLCRPGWRRSMSPWWRGWHGSCRVADFYIAYPTAERAMLQIYSESKIAAYLRRVGFGAYAVAVVCGPDQYFLQPAWTIVSEVLHAQQNASRGVFTSTQNAEYTNGFYVGRPDRVALVAGRYEEFRDYERQWYETGSDYEGVLGDAYRRHRIERRVSSVYFFKVRASCKVSWQAPYGFRNGNSSLAAEYRARKEELEDRVRGWRSCSCSE